MQLESTPEDKAFRAEVRAWLAGNLTGEFAALRGLGGPGREHEAFPQRLAWNRRLAAAGYTCLGWPTGFGGRGASITQQVIFYEEYARAKAPARVGYIGEELLGPTLIAFGTPAQRRRFLPKIASVQELWCQGYSEPGAGSDLASVATSATMRGGRWVITGQKVWTSLATVADWCFVLARTEPGSRRHHGLSYLLVPMRQPGVEVRPIRQMTGTSEFNEVFFDGAQTDAGLVVGEVGGGWRVAMGTLALERGIATLGTQVTFREELDGVVELARSCGAIGDPVLRDRLARARIGLEVMHAHAVRTLAAESAPRVPAATGSPPLPSSPAASAPVAKLLWAGWHRALGELAMDVLGMAGVVLRGGTEDRPDLDGWQRLFLFSRADTIYGGSDEVLRTIVAERVLGLPRETQR